MAELASGEYATEGVLNEESYSRPMYSEMHRLVREQELDKIKSLVNGDSRVVEAPDLMNKRAIHVACSIPSGGDVVDYLLKEVGAKPTALALDAMSPLHIAVASNAGRKAVESILAHKEGKGTIEWKTKNGKTALDIAFEKRMESIARLLCEKGGAVITTVCREAAEGHDMDGLKVLVEEFGTAAPHNEETSNRVSPPPAKKQRA